MKTSVTVLKRSIEFYKDVDPAHSAKLQAQLVELQNKRKNRRALRKLKGSSQALALPQVSTTIENFQLEVHLFANQVLKQQGILGKIVFCSRQRSFARKNNREGNSVHFGSQSIQRAASEGFTEYFHIRRMIWPFVTTGITGVRLLVLHELAHLAVFQKYSYRVLPHGPEFQREYSLLLHKYSAALESR